MTVITHVLRIDGKLVVRGTTSDNGTVKRVTVNGHEAKSVGGNYAQWELAWTGALPEKLIAKGEDAAGNVEKVPHAVRVPAARP